MAPTILATISRRFVTRFFERYVSTGCLIFKEDGGTVFTFKGNMDKCPLTVVLKVHSPQFYWKVLTLPHHYGFANAYGEGDFSCEDEDEGLLNLFQIFTATREYNSSPSGFNKKRGWGLPAELFKATVALAKFVLKPFSRSKPDGSFNLTSEFFETFAGKTMQISCPIYKELGEPNEVAQRRKMSALIKKARIEKGHEVLEIGCGYGLLGIEIVKRTGCKYTGVEVLSEEQRKFAEARVKEAGLEDNIKFINCDFRKLPKTTKYDRIIACEVIDQLRNEGLEESFECCDSLLAEDGLMVIQIMSDPDNLLHNKIKSPGFLNKYVVPNGGWVLLNKVLSAMAAKSGLCVEHLENIGPSYYTGMRCFRQNFLKNKSKLLELGFNEQAQRAWIYYLDYMSAAYKTRWLYNYQIVFSRPGNLAALGDPYQGFPSAYSC